MDPMTASTSYTVLEKKYRGFGAPTVRIEVDGVDIIQKKGAVAANITVDLTNGFSASGCAFDIVDEYQPKNTAFRSKGPLGALQLGAKVKLALGYIVTETVFCGYVAEVEYIFDNEDRTPYIHVECMDVKGLLMKTQRLEIMENKKLSEAISDLFSSQPVSAYTEGKQVDILSSKKEMQPMAHENDYQFAVRCARYTGCEFFVIQGKVYFRKPPMLSAPILSLSPKSGIVSFKLSLRQSSLFKNAEVVGINPEDDKQVSGKAGISGKFSKGSTSSRMLGSTTKVFFDHNVTSASDANARAKTLVEGAQNDFGRLECKTVGLPELVPGRSVRISGLMPEADVTCYILDVRHMLDESGFFTKLEARISKL